MKTHENDMKTFHSKMKTYEKNKVYHSVSYCFLAIFMLTFEFAGTLKKPKTLAGQAFKAYYD